MRSKGDLVVALAFFVFIVYGGVTAMDFPPRSRAFPYVVALVAAPIALARVFLCARNVLLSRSPALEPAGTAAASPVEAEAAGQPVRDLPSLESLAKAFVAAIVLGVLIAVLGFLVAVPVYVAAYLFLVDRASWRTIVLSALFATLAFMGMDQLGMRLPGGMLGL